MADPGSTGNCGTSPSAGMDRRCNRWPSRGRRRILREPVLRWGRPLTCGRVLRGGAWNNNQDNARSAFRNRNNPNNRNNNVGFRVLCSSHIFHPLRGTAPAAPSGRAGSTGTLVCFRHCPPTTVCGPRRGGEDGAGRSRPHDAGLPRRRAHIKQGRRPDSLPRRPALRCAAQPVRCAASRPTDDRSQRPCCPRARTDHR